MSNEIAKLFVTVGANTDGFKKGMTAMNDTLKKVSVGMMAAGGVIVGGLVAATKAAKDEQIGINRLAAQLKNVGVEYNDVSNSLEQVIAATQRKTSIADDKQREALGDLLIATNDYQKALELMPLVLDLAAAKQMDLGTAAELVGKVAEGNLGTLSRYGIVMQEGATASEALAELQKRVGGTAEAAADPMATLSASIGDLGETIGGALLGDMNNFLGKATDIVIGITDWIKVNPELVRTIGMVGIALIGGGGILYAITSVSKAIIALNAALIIMHGLTGVGWLKIAAGLAIAGAGIFAMNELIKTPSIPAYANGGVVPGSGPQLAMVHGGETITPAGQSGGNLTVQLFIDGEQVSGVVEKRLYDRIRYQEVPSYL